MAALVAVMETSLQLYNVGTTDLVRPNILAQHVNQWRCVERVSPRSAGSSRIVDLIAAVPTRTTCHPCMTWISQTIKKKNNLPTSVFPKVGKFPSASDSDDFRVFTRISICDFRYSNFYLWWAFFFLAQEIFKSVNICGRNTALKLHQFYDFGVNLTENALVFFRSDEKLIGRISVHTL